MLGEVYVMISPAMSAGMSSACYSAQTGSMTRQSKLTGMPYDGTRLVVGFVTQGLTLD